MDLLNNLLSKFNIKHDSKTVRDCGMVVAVTLIALNVSNDNILEIKKLINEFPSRDKASITLSTVNYYNVTFNNYEPLKASCSTKITEFKENLEDDDEIDVIIRIDKSVKNNMFSIYNYDSFMEDLLSLSFVDVIDRFQRIIDTHDYLNFVMFDSNNHLYTSTLSFQPHSEEIATDITTFNRSQRLEKCKDTSTFMNIINYKLIPDDFTIIRSNIKELSNLFGSLQTMLSLVYISNNSFIEKNTLNIEISGHRSNKYTFDLTNSEVIKTNNELFKIYNWIYQDGHPIDKSIIARNIISLHCRYSCIIDIDYKTYASICSNYAVYQKDNAAQYIELKTKLGEYINTIVANTCDIVLSLSDRLKKNILACFTYILTVYLSSLISAIDFEDIFTHDITIITYIIIFGSLLFMGLCMLETSYKLKKIVNGYNKFKYNYNDLLDETDIKTIFKDDEIINESVKDVKGKKILIVVIWFFLLLALTIIVDYLSSYSHIMESLSNFFTLIIKSISELFEKLSIN